MDFLLPNVSHFLSHVFSETMDGETHAEAFGFSGNRKKKHTIEPIILTIER